MFTFRHVGACLNFTCHRFDLAAREKVKTSSYSSRSSLNI